ncbi:hypothetical protein ACWCQV_28180, partial [Streptomyces eurythermus]
MSTSSGAAVTRASSAVPASARQVPVLWLALLAAPVAAAGNAAVLILRDLGRSLGTSTATASWLVTVYALALAVATPLFATLLRRRGTRPAPDEDVGAELPVRLQGEQGGGQHREGQQDQHT